MQQAAVVVVVGLVTDNVSLDAQQCCVLFTMCKASKAVCPL